MRWIPTLRMTWVALACAALGAPGAAQDAPAEPEARLRAQLATQRLTCDFVDAPIPTILEHLKQQSGVNLVCDRAVLEDLTNNETRATVQLADVPVGVVLDWVLESVGLAWVVRDGVLYVTTPEHARQPVVIRLHDVRDLLVTPADFPAAARDLPGTFRATGPVITEEPTGLVIEELIEVIRTSIAASEWEQADTRLSAVAGVLLVSAQPWVQAEITRFLGGLRALGSACVAVEVRVVEVEAATAHAVRAAAGGAPVLSAEAEALLERALGTPAGRLVAAGMLTGYNTQRIGFRDGAQRRLVAPALAEAAVEDGLTLDVRPVLVAGRAAAHLNVRGRFARRPVAGPGSGVRQDVCRFATSLVCPLGATTLLASGSIGAPPPGDAPLRETLCLCRVTTPGASAPAPARRDAEPTPAAAGPSILARLRGQRVSLDFHDTPLAGVVQYFRDTTASNLLVAPAVFEETPEDSLRINLQLRDVSAADALQIVTAMTNLAVVERPWYLLLTTRAQAPDASVLAVYDIRDLVLARGDRPAPLADLATPVETAATDDAELEALTADDVVNLVREQVASDVWDTPPHSIEPRAGTIVARAPVAVHRGIEGLLAELRAVTSQTVWVEALVLDVPRATWLAAGLGAVCTPAQAAEVARRAAAGDGMRLVGTARVAGLNGQRFHVHAGRDLAQLEGYTCLATDGCVVDVRPVCSAAGDEVHAEVRLATLRAGGAADVREGGLAGGEVRTNVTLPTGGAVALGSFRTADGPGTLVVLRISAPPAR